MWVASTCPCPNQSAITVVSIPAFSKRIAAVCLRAWGVTFLARIDGQCSPAAAACFARRWLVRRWLISVVAAAGSATQPFGGPSGLSRSMNPTTSTVSSPTTPRAAADRVPDRVGSARGRGPRAGDPVQGGPALAKGEPDGQPGRVRAPDTGQSRAARAPSGHDIGPS